LDIRDNIKPVVGGKSLDMAIKALEQYPKYYPDNMINCWIGKEVLYKIQNDIQSLRNCSCSTSDGIIDDVEDIIGKYIEESEDKE
jgi:hypothetical protein